VRWRLKVRSYLVVLVLAVLLPVVTFAAVAVTRLSRLERSTSEQGMRETARALALAIDRELAGARSALFFLVVSPHLRAGDLDAFHRQALDALTLPGTAIVLSDPSGRELLSAQRPAGACGPVGEAAPTGPEVAETGRPAITDVFRGPASDQPLVAVSVPAFEGPRVRYVLSLVLTPPALNSILLELKFSPTTIAAIYDRHGVAITRTVDTARIAGQPGPAQLIATMTARGEGWVRDRAADGLDAYFAFSRSKVSGWTVAFAEPASAFDQSLRRSLWTVGAGGILATLVAVGMAVLVGGRISGSIGALSAAAPALLAGARGFAVPASPLREINDLAAALEGARETMLRQSQHVVTTNRTLQALIHASPLPIVILDGDLRVRLWSPSAERVLGFQAEEVVGRPFPVASEAERQEFARALRAQVSGNVGPGFETQRRRKDGSIVEVSMWVAPLSAEDVDTVVVILADITARRRAQEGLRRRGEQLQILSHAAHQINSVLQVTTVLRTLVRSAMELVEGSGGMAGLVLDGHVVFGEHHEGERVRSIDLTIPVGQGIAGHVVKTAQPYVTNDASGDPVAAAEVERQLGCTTLVAVPIFRRDGGVLGCFQVHDKRGGRPFDADDVVLLEGLAASAAIALENARLLVEREEADRAKDQFLASLSHELRTPLTAILGWTRMLRSGRLDAAGQTTALETIERNTRLQTQLIEDLLDVSRIISGKLQLDREPVELAGVIATAAQSLVSVADAKSVALRLDVDAAGALVEGDPHRLQQVVLNLLSNAIKFTPAHGRIDVRLERDGSRARLVVSDTGQGIAPAVLPHVFEPFRQADGTHTKQHGGLGLGLAIVRHLIALHGGTVRAESEGVGRGATFTVELPLAGPVEREAPRARARRGDGERTIFDCPPVLEGLRILVVEDDPDARRFVTRVLEECKAEVMAVGSAIEALDTLPRVRPHVLVSDIGMPRTDGYELMRMIRSRRPADGGLVHALALTAYASAEDRRRVLAAGYQLHIAKPVDPADLVDAVAELADRAAAIDGVRTMEA
jgi:PAS domain S-box-containing protein